MEKYPIHIVPSILSADFTRLGEQIQAAESGGADAIHIDVMDGRFVPNITMGPLVVEAARRATTIPLDVHLMIVEPERYLEAFADAGASAITVHLEATPHLHGALQTIRKLGCQAGVAINPHTPASALSEVMHMLDKVLVMTVNPGFGGQSFLAETLPKITQLRTIINENDQKTDIGVDGGINVKTITRAAQAGANFLIAGSAIYTDKYSREDGIRALREAVKEKSRIIRP